MIKKVCVFCASSDICDIKYIKSAEILGEFLAKKGLEIIYGGGREGLMGGLARGALRFGGKVIGVIPKIFTDFELEHKEIAEIRQVNNLHEREYIMLTEADCFIALPGGCGTIEEILQAFTWKYLGIIRVPFILVNINNYYDSLIEMLGKSVQEGFLEREALDLWKVVNNIEEAREYIEGNLLDTLD